MLAIFNNIVADALSRLEKDEDEILSETEEGLVLSHAMCAVEQGEAILLPETKHDLVHHIMNVDEMESEEFPMSPEIIAREQKKDTHFKEVMKKSDKFSDRIVESLTSLYLNSTCLFYYALPVRQMSFSIPHLSRKEAGIYCTVGS
jgi:hypothetical protein